MKRKQEELQAQGFTIIELMLAIAIAGIVMASFYSVYISQQSSYLRQEKVASMHQNIRSAMYYMGREIRMAGLDPTGEAGAGIVRAEENLIQFTEDIRGQNENNPPDGDTGDSNEDITYTLDDKDGDGDTDLVRNTGNGNFLLAENIKSLLFKYLEGDGITEATLSAAIRFVDITLKAVTDDGSSDRTMTARIHCRNLGY
jgi:type IV pilus assembly protein PilW